jgi:restriction endonuclease Mrr
VLIYTGAGKSGEQSIGGANARILQQLDHHFPIYGFILLGSRRKPEFGAKRWAFLGMMQYLRCYPERQIDSKGTMRKAWVFELRACSVPQAVEVRTDRLVMEKIMAAKTTAVAQEDREVLDTLPQIAEDSEKEFQQIESTRRKLLAFTPQEFEHVLKDLLIQTGFENVEVTKYSQDGGIDLNACPGQRYWPICHLLVQIQAKRWLHTVGRKEVAELRGSMKPHAAGCVVTTSHFSRAALTESVDQGKVPINLIDGHQLGRLVNCLDLKIR